MHRAGATAVADLQPRGSEHVRFIPSTWMVYLQTVYLGRQDVSRCKGIALGIAVVGCSVEIQHGGAWTRAPHLWQMFEHCSFAFYLLLLILRRKR